MRSNFETFLSFASLIGLSLSNTLDLDFSFKEKNPLEYQCADLDLEICKSLEDQNVGLCLETQVLNKKVSWNKMERPSSKLLKNVSHVLSVSSDSHCHLTLCDDHYRMGNCVQFPPGVNVVAEKFEGILQPWTLGVHCRCTDEKKDGGLSYSDQIFDKNYFGIIYTPYDKPWKPAGPNNGPTRPVTWSEYSEYEITAALKQISKNFTNIATFGMGTVSNTFGWNKGDKVGIVPYLVAKINRDLGYPALRVAVGIFRKDDMNTVWKSKEFYNAIDAARSANLIFNGTVWGIIVTSDFVSDSATASVALDMIREVKEINQRYKLHMKVGIRLETCEEYIRNERLEDDLTPFYIQNSSSMRSTKLFQDSLYKIANVSDFICCAYFTSPSFARFPMEVAIKDLQSRFLVLRNTLRRIRPNLKLVIETGIPSEGVGKGYENSRKTLRDYWMSMAQFAKEKHIMFHMFEAIDQPWKNLQDASRDGLDDSNGPNGSDSHYGWLEKVKRINQPTIKFQTNIILTLAMYLR